MAMIDRKDVCVALLAIVTLSGLAEAARYKPCSEGCCEHEFCVYDLICYPALSCPRSGCPDGACVLGEDGERGCVPSAPCLTSDECPDGHSCAVHPNLGYPTCQYDNDAPCRPKQALMPAGAPDAWHKRSFLARWRGKAAFRPRGQKASPK